MSAESTETKRATISMTPKVWNWARELMEEGGYASFSALVAELIREARTAGRPRPHPPERERGHGQQGHK